MADDNPLGKSIDNVIIYGSSQSGRWIRTFIQLGFNQDENRNLVVEGAIPHKASNRGAFNVRFGQPDRLSGTQHTERQSNLIDVFGAALRELGAELQKSKTKSFSLEVRLREAEARIAQLERLMEAWTRQGQGWIQ